MPCPLDFPGSGLPSPGDPDLEFLRRVVDRLVCQRKIIGMSLRRLSEVTGYDFSYLSKAERGLAQPGLVPLRKWSHALGLSFAKLIVSESDEESI